MPAEVAERAPGFTLPTDDRVDREGVVRAKRVESSTKDHPQVDAVLADLDGALQA